MPIPKMSVIGDSIRLVPAGSPAFFELSALGFNSNEIDVQIISKYLFININFITLEIVVSFFIIKI